MDEVIKAFPIGSWARSTKTERFGPLLTTGVDGLVRKHHAEAGVLVKLYVSRIYEPSFWFKAGELQAWNGPQVLPISSDAIEYMLGGRGAILSNNPISMGMMRSWLLWKMRVAPGHPIEEVVRSVKYEDVYPMFRDSSNINLNRWAELNDTRARRTVVTDTESNVGTVLVRRNKIL